jgi:hypothetical protein
MESKSNILMKITGFCFHPMLYFPPSIQMPDPEPNIQATQKKRSKNRNNSSHLKFKLAHDEVYTYVLKQGS